MGTEGEHRSEEQQQGWQVDTDSHVKLYLQSLPAAITERQSVLQVIQCNANSEAETGFLKPAQAFHGPPNTSARVFLIEARLGSASCTRAKTMRDGRNGKSVPLTAAKEAMVVLHTYCFFCACEARSLAFSLAASAVSLARSVAVSVNVLDRVSPEGATVAVAVEET